MKKRFKRNLWIILLLIVCKLIWVFTMHDSGADVLSGKSRNDLLSRRQYLVNKVNNGKMNLTAMPSYIPTAFKREWLIGTNSMFAAALTNIAFIYPQTREEALEIVRELINNMLDDEARQFEKLFWGEDALDSLSGDNGNIGYLGHLNWMLGAYKFLGGDASFDDLHDNISAALYRRLNDSPGLCLKTFPYGLLFVPDNVVVVASLANYARLHDGKYQDVVTRWVEHARENWLDPELKLLSFHLDENCLQVPGVRGSGVGWNSFYLPFIDEQFAAEQFTQIKKHFVQDIVITGIREFPGGVSGRGDFGSGPVLFGLSTSGTGFGMAGAGHANDAELLDKLLWTGELAGFSVEWNGERHYLVAPLVGEAIILAMKTLRVWDDRYVTK